MFEAHTKALFAKLPRYLTSLTEPIKCQCFPHIETNQLIYCAYQLTGLYMRATLALSGLSKYFQKVQINFLTQTHLSHLYKLFLFWFLLQMI